MRNRGFSLLELLIVIGLMSTAALLALSAVDQGDNQRRFEETRSKLRQMQQAILGESREINGLYSQSGFIADMGRLPYDIKELLVQPDDCDKDTSGNQPCDWQYDADSETWGGWHGPYLRGVLAGDEHAAEYDGWGYEWHLLDGNSLNPWQKDNASEGTLTILSIGLDAVYSFDASNQLDNSPEKASKEAKLPDAAYKDSAKQSFTLQPHQYLHELPYNPLKVEIILPPKLGQCVDKKLTAQKTCEDENGKKWDQYHQQCVDASYETPKECEESGFTDYVWAAVYGHCKIGNEDNFILGVDTQNKCKKYDNSEWITAEKENIDGRDEFIPTNPVPNSNINYAHFCLRPIHIRHGRVGASHYVSQANPRSVLNSSLSASNNPNQNGNESIIRSMVIDTSSSAEQRFRLPFGPVRFGLYHYDDIKDECTPDPYPSKTAQGRSAVFLLSHDHPFNQGTSGKPIEINWRSR